MQIPIVPFCKAQLKDIKDSDLISDSIRFCNIEHAMNGIDKFRALYFERFNKDTKPDHVITQVFGCTQSCPYCYVTSEGIWGAPKMVDISDLFLMSTKNYPDGTVFHLMGGAPALYLNCWLDIINQLYALNPSYVFHSDFLLDEGLYDQDILKRIGKIIMSEPLFAVSFKSSNLSELQLENLDRLNRANIKYYATFTGMTPKDKDKLYKQLLRHNTHIPFDGYDIPIYWGFKAFDKES